MARRRDDDFEDDHDDPPRPARVGLAVIAGVSVGVFILAVLAVVAVVAMSPPESPKRQAKIAAPLPPPPQPPPVKTVADGGIRVVVERAEYAKPELVAIDTDAVTGPALAIHVRIKNESDSRVFNYHTWGDLNATSSRAALRDSFGNEYRPESSGSRRPVGGVRQVRLDPGQEATDVLLFEKPLRSAEQLVLSLPLSAFEERRREGKLEVAIPAREIAWRAD